MYFVQRRGGGPSEAHEQFDIFHYATGQELRGRINHFDAIQFRQKENLPQMFHSESDQTLHGGAPDDTSFGLPDE